MIAAAAKCPLTLDLKKANTETPISCPGFLLFTPENQHFSDCLKNKNNKYIRGFHQQSTKILW